MSSRYLWKMARISAPGSFVRELRGYVALFMISRMILLRL